MIFQTLDDKSECVGVYVDGSLHFEEVPQNLTKTWKHTGLLCSDEVDYAWLRCGGKSLQEACPTHLQSALERHQARFKAYLKSFQIGKIDLRRLCFFDLVPHDFLLEFCEIRNKITEHVFEEYSEPQNYEHLKEVHALLHKIKFQNLKVSPDECRHLLVSSADRNSVKKILAGPHHIDYNLFGTVTGRLTTGPGSLPILTMKKTHRKLIKPQNDWFLSLDYNGAEARTVTALMGHEQPDGDIHEWNIRNIFKNPGMPREEAKTLFFAWIYNPNSQAIKDSIYDRNAVLKEYYDGEKVHTPMRRTIAVDDHRALNYLIQSTCADLTLDRAVALDTFLENKKSFVSHIVHDEVVIDLDDSERDLVPQMREIFEETQLGRFPSNVNAGKDYGDLKELKL